MRLELENLKKLLGFLYKGESFALNKRKVKNLAKTAVHKIMHLTSFEENQQIFEETRRVFTLFSKVLPKNSPETPIFSKTLRL